MPLIKVGERHYHWECFFFSVPERLVAKIVVHLFVLRLFSILQCWATIADTHQIAAWTECRRRADQRERQALEAGFLARNLKNWNSIERHTTHSKKSRMTPERRAWVKNYRLRNHERLRAKEREYEKKYREENKDKIRARIRHWYARNKEREVKRLTEWFKTDLGIAARLRAQEKRKKRYREDPEYHRADNLRHKGDYAKYKERCLKATREWQKSHHDKVYISWVKKDLKKDWGISNPSDVFLQAVINYRKCLRLLREKNNHRPTIRNSKGITKDS